MWKWILILGLAMTTNLSAEAKILAFSGSARDDSFNKKLISEAAQVAKQLHAEVNVVDLKNYALPFYDQDLETKDGMPSKAKELQQLMIQSNIIIIASPEYNGSLSAILKNTIDWLSRSVNGGGSREAFKGKKFILMSTSPGLGGGARGLAHLRTIIENIGGTVLSQQIVVPDAFNAFDERGHLKNEKYTKEMEQAIQAAMN